MHDASWLWAVGEQGSQKLGTMRSAGLILCLCLGAARAMDRDGDGVTDAAPDGQCCAIMHMMGDFSSCSSWTGSTDLASMAGCCPSDWLLRWSLVGSAGAATEDRSMVDCVKFVAYADCVPPTGWIGVATFKSVGCPHSLPTQPPTTLKHTHGSSRSRKHARRLTHSLSRTRSRAHGDEELATKTRR